MISFSQVKGVQIPEGAVTKIMCDNNVLWSMNKYKYVKGQLVCENGNRFNNYSEDTGEAWELDLVFKVDDLSSEKVLAKNIYNTSTGWYVKVNTSGQIEYYTYYNNSNTYTFSPKVKVGEWNTISMRGQNSLSSSTSGQVTLALNGESDETSSMYQVMLTRTARSVYIGDDGVSLRDTIRLKGSYYASSTTTTYHTLSVNVEEATVGEPLSLTDTYTLSGGMVYEDVE